MTGNISRAALSAFLAAVLCGTAADAANLGAVAPFFRASDVQGRPVSLGELVASRRVVVLFWDWRRATSVRAMQVLDRLQETYAKQGIEVLAVEGEGTAVEQVLERVEKLRAIGIAQRYTVVPDPGGRIARQFRVESTPQIFLLDRAGRVAFHLDGFRSGDERALEESVKVALGLVAVPDPSSAAKLRPPGPGAATAEPPVPKAAPADPREALLEKYRYFGNYSLNRGDPAKAEEYFRKYVELAPGDIDVWLRIGEACARQRLYDHAREAWEEVLRLQPGNREADANIRRLIRGEY